MQSTSLQPFRKKIVHIHRAPTSGEQILNMVRTTLQAQTRNVCFVETSEAGRTGFIIDRYSTDNNGLLRNNRLRSQGKVVTIDPK
jgi:hypothetical protein